MLKIHLHVLPWLFVLACTTSTVATRSDASSTDAHVPDGASNDAAASAEPCALRNGACPSRSDCCNIEATRLLYDEANDCVRVGWPKVIGCTNNCFSVDHVASCYELPVAEGRSEIYFSPNSHPLESFVEGAARCTIDYVGYPRCP